MDYKEYFSLLFQQIPEYVFEGALSVLLIGIVLTFSFLKVRKGMSILTNLILIEYVFLIYSSTVIFRDTNETSIYKPISLDIYKDILEGGCVHVAPEIFFNVLCFVPIGLLLCGSAKWMKWWHIILIGCGVSISIEVMQYVFRRGTMEIVDVIHNTLGCAIGVMIVAAIKGILRTCSYVFALQKRSKFEQIVADIEILED